MAGIGVREEQAELQLSQLPVQPQLLNLDLRAQLGVASRQVVELGQVTGTALQTVPEPELVAQLGRLSGQLAGGLGVVPDPGPGQLLV